MNLRRFLPGDEDALWRVHYSAIHQIAARDYSAEQINAWAPSSIAPESWAAHMRSNNPFVVEEAGEIVAYADLQPSGYIDHFFVAGEHARRGIGSLLLKRLITEAQTLGIGELSANVSKTAQPLFSRFGFVIVELRAPVRHGVTLPNALMRRLLG